MKTRFIQSLFFLILSLVMLMPSALVYAQFASTNDEESVLVNITPKNPQPGQAITFKVTSFLSDLDRSTITWTVNGKQEATGLGLKEFSTRMGTVGATTRVNLSIVTNEAVTITKNFSFTGGRVDLIWETDSYTPPFYKGKALLTPNQYAKVVAVPLLGPSTTTLSPTNLIYTWERDGRVLGSLSGVGKNVLFLDRTQTNKETRIKVTVSNQDGSLNAVGETTLIPIQPKLISYMYSPAYGPLFNIALRDAFQISTKEVSLVAVPYYYDITEATLPFLDYVWAMNNQTANSVENIFTVRNEASTTGEARIDVSAANQIGTFIQKETTSFTISF